jgi:hypothetical protein
MITNRHMLTGKVRMIFFMVSSTEISANLKS